MTIIIRAEDFEIAEGRLVVGQRVISVNAIFSHSLSARMSLELFGFSFSAAAALTGCSLVQAVPARFSLAAVAIVFVVGAAREFMQRYVLAIHIYQLGSPGAKGFNKAKAEHQQAAFTDMNRQRLTNDARSVASRTTDLRRIFNLQNWNTP